MTLEVGVSIGSRASRAMVTIRTRCCEAPMSRCTRPRRRTPAARSTRRRSTSNSVRRLSVLSEFRRALDADEIVVLYQPIIAWTAAAHGAEALVRWQHPELGLLPPSDFMPIVEQTGLIGPLTRHVLERAVAQCAAWQQAGHELIGRVNLSVRNLLDPDLSSLISDLLTIYRLTPRRSSSRSPRAC